ncbi:SPOR domain-containing protein [Tannockella kyphosi]|uniref:SPOR domain-containing protein n=1 Tax=Tannockella kyphosi TaxID=2899121 RepID=UPI0020136AB1|nr:SPOR domain-containing protein [Tannockella kyphosi]
MKPSYKVSIIAIIFAILFSFFYQFCFGNENYVVYVCQVGVYSNEDNANGMLESLELASYQGEIIDDEDMYKVVCGVFIEEKEASVLEEELKAEGFSVAIIEYIVSEEGYDSVEKAEYTLIAEVIE